MSADPGDVTIGPPATTGTGPAACTHGYVLVGWSPAQRPVLLGLQGARRRAPVGPFGVLDPVARRGRVQVQQRLVFGLQPRWMRRARSSKSTSWSTNTLQWSPSIDRTRDTWQDRTGLTPRVLRAQRMTVRDMDGAPLPLMINRPHSSDGSWLYWPGIRTVPHAEQRRAATL
jgi:hypothetical protein